MKAILRRELHAFFTGLIGPLVLAVGLLVIGIYTAVLSFSEGYANFEVVLSNTSYILLFLVPLLTMRLFSEERKYKTDQILLTSPINITPLVLGKFFSALTIYTGCTLFTLIYALVFSYFTSPSWALITGNIFGAVLFGAAFIGIGMFISSMTESQFVAGMGSFSIATIFIILDVIPLVTSNELILSLVRSISFVGRYKPFTKGILDVSSIVFFASIAASFIFLTVRVLEKRRWS